MKTIVTSIVVACLLVLGALFFKSNSTSSDVNALIVGTNSEFAPFSFMENQELVGFDIDIAKEVGKRLGKQVKFKDMPFDALIPDLTQKNVDFIAAGMSFTEERAKRVSFTKPYLTKNPLVILALANTPHMNLESLKGKTIVVNEGYYADTFLSNEHGLKLIRLTAPADAFLAIMNNRADAFVTAQSSVESFLETQDPTKFQVAIIKGTDEICSIVVSKENHALLEKIQVALNSMEKDGTLNQLKTKWNLE